MYPNKLDGIPHMSVAPFIQSFPLLTSQEKQINGARFPVKLGLFPNTIDASSSSVKGKEIQLRLLWNYVGVFVTAFLGRRHWTLAKCSLYERRHHVLA